MAAGGDTVFRVKLLRHSGSWVRVLCQGANGPCPLLAIANCLALNGRLTLEASVRPEELVTRLADVLLLELQQASGESPLERRRRESVMSALERLPAMLGKPFC